MKLRKFLVYKKMYILIFEKKALNFLNKLERNIKDRIWSKIQQCKEDPFRFLEHLEEINGYKLRVGDYRLIIDVDQTNKILKVIKIGHRRNIYDK
ncbi:type II toxin-antitoxin system RelE/ParE family toxin [Candidatus Woesearchaeota archaeon]|nr:type II toxin-antitoxin system RelE/ParE family toxin [Candidatus Woesearchaeota archaeon]